MIQDSLQTRELVSALADGQLRGDEFARVVVSLAKSDDARDAWHAYHLVGDVLRCSDLADCQTDWAFVARLRERLSAETQARPAAGPGVEVALIPVGRVPHAGLQRSGDVGGRGANDPVARWKLLAAAASVAAIAVVGWHLASGDVGFDQPAGLATVPSGANLTSTSGAQAGVGGMIEPPVMLRDARLDELMAAHKQFGGTSALQKPAGFLRNATFEGPVR